MCWVPEKLVQRSGGLRVTGLFRQCKNLKYAELSHLTFAGDSWKTRHGPAEIQD